MTTIIGSARIDENGNAVGGKAGDQTGKEVSTQNFYVHKKGWYVIRPKSAEHADRIAECMRRACANDNIGYDQGNRYGVIKNGTGSKVKTEADCSSLVRACVKEATGVDPGDFNTESECSALDKTGLFESRKQYTSGMKLCTGDILVTRTKGHTVIVTQGADRTTQKAEKLDVDGSWGRLTTTALQKIFKTTIDGEVSRQPFSNKEILPAASTISWEFLHSWYTGGSMLILAMQRKFYKNGYMKVKPDGFCGKETVKALQKWLKTDVTGLLDTQTVKVLQKWANKKL